MIADSECIANSLDKIHKRDGAEAFVATFSGVKTEDGPALSYSVWGEGVDTLLPESDLAAFCKPGDEQPVAFGPWQPVRAAAGELMEPRKHYPARWRVRGFPEPAALEQIGNKGLAE